MKNRFTKYGFMIIAAVLLVALAFAGAASADTANAAKIGTTEYPTVEAAFDAATSGQTIVLLKNSELTGMITVSKTVTLDLNGKALTAASNERLFTVESGVTFTIEDNGTPGTPVSFKYSSTGPWQFDESMPTGATIVNLAAFNLTDADAASGNYYVKVTGGILYGGQPTESSSNGNKGGAVYVHGGTLKLKGGNIVGCTVQGSTDRYGGAVYLDSNSEFIMTGGSIAGCRVDSDGGAVYAGGSSSKFTMTGGSITGCSARYGGAVYVNLRQFEMSDTSIINGCKASDQGGAIYVNGGSFTMTGGSITGCKAGSYGGAIYASNGSFTMTGGSITTCSAGCGGGVYLKCSNGLTCSFAMSGTSSITGCTATQLGGTPCGGGVYVFEGSSFTMSGSSSIKNCTINHNQGYGGGVYSAGPFTMSDSSSISGCQITYGSDAGGHGGGVYSAGPFTMSGSSSIKDCTARKGGGVNVDEGSFTMKDTCSITKCSAKSFGGGVYLDDSVSFTMNGGDIASCKATVDGGGVFASDMSKITMTGGNITGCEATQDGGGVSIANDAELSMSDGNITSCTAGENGGGVCIGVEGDVKDLYAPGIFTMSGGSISGCSATGHGDGVFVSYGHYADGGKVNDYYSTFTISNKAYVAAGNEVYLPEVDKDAPSFTNITCGTGGFLTGAAYGVFNIALGGTLSTWEGKTVVKGGANYGDNFKLSTDSAYYGYTLVKGTATGQTDDLVFLNGYPITYKNLPEGANNPNPTIYRPSQSITLLDASADGYTFEGWYEDEELTTKITVIPTGLSEEPIIYANIPPNVTAVTFVPGSEPIDYTFGEPAEIPTEPTQAGYVLHWINSDDGKDITDATYTKDGKWNYIGNKKELTFKAEYTVIITPDVPAIDGVATFGDKNCTALITPEKVSNARLDSVTYVTGTVTFIADNKAIPVPTKPGYTETGVAVFNIEATPADDHAFFIMTLTLADKNDMDKIRFWHYNVDKSMWDQDYLQYKCEADESDEKVITYEVKTDSFSPFAITLEKKNSSGSHQGGSRILPATDAPTVTPTQQPTTDATPLIPTAKPTTQQTQKSPAPLAGLVLGLGAAAVLLRLRR